jgi:SAM-dependent methyltransferase
MITIGRQTVYLKKEQLEVDMLRYFNRKIDRKEVEIDNLTRDSNRGNFIKDTSFWKTLTNYEIEALDISDYEDANIIHDMCKPLPKKYENAYDFIFNGSCLDNIFDPATAIKNISRLMKRSGRVIHIERVSRVHFAYIAFSLAWFHDYYAINNFKDCKVYLVLWKGNTLEDSDWSIYRYLPYVNSSKGESFHEHDRRYDESFQSHAIVIAEKGDDSTFNKHPVQYYYRTEAQNKKYLEMAKKYEKTKRPDLKFGNEAKFIDDHYRSCGILTRINR